MNDASGSRANPTPAAASEQGPRGDWALAWITAIGLLGVIVWLIANPIGPINRPSPHAPSIEPEASPPSPALKAQTLAVWTSLRGITDPCDQAVAAVSRHTPPPSDPRAPAPPVRLAQERCRDAGFGLLSLQAPAALGKAERADFEAALRQCQHVYIVEANAHGRLAQALDRANGSITLDRPAVFEAWVDVQEANLDAQSCRIGVIGAARRAGLPMGLFYPDTPVRGAANGVTAVRSSSGAGPAI
jgi:hypothetical protein